MGKTMISGSTSVPANQTINVLAGSRFENIYEDGMIDFLATGSAVGLTAQLFAGNRNLVESADLGAQNRAPLDPDDLKLDDGEVYEGDKLVCNVSNSTAGALTVFWKFVMDNDVYYDDEPY